MFGKNGGYILKGIILAGGNGTRLLPITYGISKQMIPVYDKPLFFYPLSQLIEFGITELLIICAPDSEQYFQKYLSVFRRLNLNISLMIQHHPGGIAEALIIGENFIGDDSVCLILGDNVFHGLSNQLMCKTTRNAKVFAVEVEKPDRYGVLDDRGTTPEIKEKPKKYISNWAIPGCYFFPREAPSLALTLRPSARDELEISDLINIYGRRGRLDVQKLSGENVAWFDAGLPDALLETSEYVRSIQQRSGGLVGCPFQSILRRGLIQNETFELVASEVLTSSYIARIYRNL